MPAFLPHPRLPCWAVLVSCCAWAGLLPAPGRAAGPEKLAAPAQAAPEVPLGLPGLWRLAEANNPFLRESAAAVEEARGRFIQAGKYPNPSLSYSQQELGTPQSPAGSILTSVNQEILTAGKRGLDVAIAARGIDVAGLAAVGRRFEVLTRIRQDYYDFLGWRYTVWVNQSVVATLEQGVALTRKLVEQARTRPRSDLLRLQTLVEEAKSNLERSQINMEVSWRRLAAEVGVPRLPMPEVPPNPSLPVPYWDLRAVGRRVLAVHTDIRQAAAEAERARLEVARAKAEAVPNVTLGAGYSYIFPEKERGAVINLDVPLPVWDRKQGRIYEAQARWTRALAARRSAVTRLTQETVEAYGRYKTAREQLDRLRYEILPRLAESLRLVRQGYQAGAATVSFADVLLAERDLNDARLRQADYRRELWRAVADLEGLMQLDVAEEFCNLAPLEPPAPVRK